jgi:hypothetical protein
MAKPVSTQKATDAVFAFLNVAICQKIRHKQWMFCTLLRVKALCFFPLIESGDFYKVKAIIPKCVPYVREKTLVGFSKKVTFSFIAFPAMNVTCVLM